MEITETKLPTDIEKVTFYETIKSLTEEKSITYLEALVFHCENQGLEIAIAAELTNNTLKKLLEEDANQLKLLKKKKVP